MKALLLSLIMGAATLGFVATPQVYGQGFRYQSYSNMGRSTYYSGSDYQNRVLRYKTHIGRQFPRPNHYPWYQWTRYNNLIRQPYLRRYYGGGQRTMSPWMFSPNQNIRSNYYGPNSYYRWR